ncbi:hypothetical protein FRC08_006839 [Ceratobasidium sp. 394]|nr:hypothetical protein FRC08_006839 [Ceratobasidium sp. 394]
MPTRNMEPEIYPRPDGTVYLCGAGGDPEDGTALPDRADEVHPAPDAIQRLKDAAEFVSSETFADAEVVAEQCCFRPNSHTGLPIIGKVREGIWLASGHGVWGIQNGPGTGKCLVGSLGASTRHDAHTSPFVAGRDDLGSSNVGRHL